MDDPVRIILTFVVLAYSCILHECAHVWVALKLGDTTGRDEGRLTLNPIPHIDPFWTILLPLILIITTGVPLGGPKPAPVNPLNFRNPRLGAMWTAVAGPATNILLAIAAVGMLYVLRAAGPDWVGVKPVLGSSDRIVGYEASWNAIFFFIVIFLNCMLAAFNLIPVPPLDGSRFLQYLLGRRSDAVMGWITRLGIIPIIVAAFWIWPRVAGECLVAMEIVLATVFGVDYAYGLSMSYFARLIR